MRYRFADSPCRLFTVLTSQVWFECINSTERAHRPTVGDRTAEAERKHLIRATMEGLDDYLQKETAMSTSEQSQARTRTFARVIGPFLAVVTATAVVRAPDLFAHISEFAADSMWTWVAGAFTLLAGLVVVALHPYWHGVAAISVSALGWLTTLKGLLLVAFPTTLLSIPPATIDEVNWWRAVYVAFALLGLYLTYVGWAPASRRPLSPAASPTQDHAA